MANDLLDLIVVRRLSGLRLNNLRIASSHVRVNRINCRRVAGIVLLTELFLILTILIRHVGLVAVVEIVVVLLFCVLLLTLISIEALMTNNLSLAIVCLRLLGISCCRILII